MNQSFSRRSMAKGAAWAVPAVAVAAAAPAMAASGVTASASTCNDFSNNCGGTADTTYRAHLSGRSANNANLYMYHGFTAGSSPIPAGTVFTWTDTFYVKTTDVSTQLTVQPKPNTQSDTYGTWAVSSISQGGTTTLSGVSYTAMSYSVTYTLSQVVPAGGSICSYVVTTPAFIRSNNTYPGISISAMTMSAGTVTNGGAYTSGTISTTAGTNTTVASCL